MSTIEGLTMDAECKNAFGFDFLLNLPHKEVRCCLGGPGGYDECARELGGEPVGA
jgi:hypothetical protein